ncbi:MAG: glutaminyl-peptide cyclotransferase [Bacteroidales bacterium]|nr:glutaminyl-peptide cyclotransferase [Bacteroidales bacterium]
MNNYTRVRDVFIILPSLIAIAVILTTCNSVPQKVPKSNSSFASVQKDFTIVSPVLDQVFTQNDTIQFLLNKENSLLKPDSTQLYINGEKRSSINNNALDFKISSVSKKVGRQNIRIKLFYNDSLEQSISSRITILSDIIPKKLDYRVLKKIPHNEKSFTQGLMFHNGFLYEGTGRNNESALNKIDPVTGKTILQRKLDRKYFGEGITYYNDHIYQITYRSQVGFVYNAESFELIREFDLQTSQGWGLTTDGKSLIMSDGSSLLYFFDPDYFTLVSQLDVCDNKASQTNLNELEYVNGCIWANVYGETYIIKIDAETGKVISKLDLIEIFPESIPPDIDHVLNGIAYNNEKQSYFITGKLWPVIYEIKIIE